MYNKQVTEYRRKAQLAYWEVKSKSENEWLRDHEEKSAIQYEINMTKFRNSIIRISMHTRNQIDKLTADKERQAEIEERRKIDMHKEWMKRQHYLQTLEVDSQRWPELDDLKDNLFVPPTVLHSREYTDRIHKLAEMADTANHEAMEKILNSEQTVEDKNKILSPLYNDLKLLIRKMTRTEEAEIVRDYSRNVARVVNHGGDDTEGNVKLLGRQYSKLISIQRSSKNSTEELAHI